MRSSLAAVVITVLTTCVSYAQVKPEFGMPPLAPDPSESKGGADVNGVGDMSRGDNMKGGMMKKSSKSHLMKKKTKKTKNMK